MLHELDLSHFETYPANVRYLRVMFYRLEQKQYAFIQLTATKRGHSHVQKNSK